MQKKSERLSQNNKITISTSATKITEFSFISEKFVGDNWKLIFDDLVSFLNINFIDLSEAELLNCIDDLPRKLFVCGRFLAKLKKEKTQISLKQEALENNLKMQARNEIEEKISEGLITSQISEGLVKGWVIKNYKEEYKKYISEIIELEEYYDIVQNLYNQIETKKFLLQIQINKLSR